MADVIKPDFSKPRAPVIFDHRSDGVACTHDHIAIRLRDRAVVCRRCKREVDAFDALVRLTRDWEWATRHSRACDEKRAELEELKRLERNCKARIRNAGGTRLEIAAAESKGRRKVR